MELASFIMTAIEDTCRVARWLNYLLFYLFPGFALGIGMMRLSLLSAMFLFDQICDYYYNGSINLSAGTPEPLSLTELATRWCISPWRRWCMRYWRSCWTT